MYSQTNKEHLEEIREVLTPKEYLKLIDFITKLRQWEGQHRVAEVLKTLVYTI
jgi:hypothetical protein